MKTLGLLRNLVTHKSQIDHVMSLYGKQIMQAVVLILESDNNAEVKEQALCILANIGKEFTTSGQKKKQGKRYLCGISYASFLVYKLLINV